MWRLRHGEALASLAAAGSHVADGVLSLSFTSNLTFAALSHFIVAMKALVGAGFWSPASIGLPHPLWRWFGHDQVFQMEKLRLGDTK